MSSPPPPDDGDETQNQTTSVRRHHTISASSRRNKAAVDESTNNDNPSPWNDNSEVVAPEHWQSGGLAGVVGSGLHRQSSLPSRYIHRNLNPNQSASGRQSGTHTPRTLNSLTAITAEHGLEGENDEVEWEREISGWHGDGEDEHSLPSPPQHSHDSSPSLPSPDYQSVVDSQAQAAAAAAAASGGVRRHASLTYGAQQAKQRAMTGGSQPLKRSGTMLATAPGRSPQPPQEIQDEEEEEEVYIPQNHSEQGEYVDQITYPQLEPQVSVNPNYGANRGSPWSPTKDWRANQYSNTQRQQIPNQGNIDDIQRALANLDMSQSQLSSQVQAQGLGQPPRFTQASANPNALRDSRSNPHLRQEGYDLRTSSFMSPIGQGPGMVPLGANLQRSPASAGRRSVSSTGQDEFDASGVGERTLRSRNSNPNMSYGSEVGAYPGGPMPPVPSIPNQYMTNQHLGQPPRLGYNMDPGRGGIKSASLVPAGASGESMLNNAVDIPSLIAAKGYNPVQFDCAPPDARFFVIKSYTEDDVHKSLKYEIWSSTDPGNKRLDKAFKDCAGRGRIFLFFSVNASGHFCGVAEMLTPLDYTRSSTVWASDKWKGVFKVRWIFVRDIPNAALRHIKLLNTQERKPVTNSRDTQELLPEAGQEMLRIFHTHAARTSLLQDFAFYELQAMQKQQQQQSGPNTSGAMPDATSPPPGSPTPSHGNIQQSSPRAYQPQHPFAMSTPYQPQQYGVGGGANGGQGYAQPQAIQTVLRGQPGGVPLPDQGYDGRF